LRLRHYELAAAGKAEQAMQEAQVLVNTAETQNRNALSDIDGAIKYILDGKDRHPTRVEIVDNINRAFKGLAPTSSTPFSATASPFVAASNTTGAFGQPSIPGLGATSTSSGFGKPSLPGIGSFGQSSGLSARPTTSFGQPTGQSTSLPNPFAQAAQSTISQPAAQNATPSPFGQPSFGAATQPSPFGQPSAPAFGQPSTSGFGQPSAPTFGQQTTSAFGKPTTLPFGQPSGAAAPTTSSAFGAPSNPFARAASASGPSTSAATANPFAKAAATPSPFAAPAQPQSAFGAPNPFAQSSTPAQPAQAAQRTSNGNSQPSSGNTLRDTSGKLKMWNGKAVEYLNNEYPCFRRPDGKLQRIWFPDGPPQWVKPPDVPDSAYDDEIQKQFMHIKQNGTFKDGTMPMLPPKRDWVDWNM
jgi:nucleoporin NUP42